MRKYDGTLIYSFRCLKFLLLLTVFLGMQNAVDLLQLFPESGLITGSSDKV